MNIIKSNVSLSKIAALFVVTIAVVSTAYSQGSVNIKFVGLGNVNVPAPAVRTAPSTALTVTAEPTVMAGITTVTIYRNDVPQATVSSSPYTLYQENLGQDTYHYFARVNYSNGEYSDSPEIKLTVYQPNIYKMGTMIGPYNTQGPGVGLDHTQNVKDAVRYISDPNDDGNLSDGGGTLFFPCNVPGGVPGEGISRYNIKDTITIPSNVTLQGESSEYGGGCQIMWRDVAYNGTGCTDNSTHSPNPGGLKNESLFKIAGGTTRVRMKDLWLHSMSSGPHCWARSDYATIQTDNTVAIEFSTTNNQHISDVVLENVSFSAFTDGIKATSTGTGHIHDIKLRSVVPLINTRQLKIDAAYAYNWDIQNYNIQSMASSQVGVEILNAGKPAVYSGDGKIKFLQLNCQGSRGLTTTEYCMKVKKHGGLILRQMHTEGVHQGVVVDDISPATNPDPIVMENGVGTGQFNDGSMNLNLIGNSLFAAPVVAAPTLDAGRLRFYGAAITNAKVQDCGDNHHDITDTHYNENPVDPNDPVEWHDLRMAYTHSERNRSSFFAMQATRYYNKKHTNCPKDVPTVTDINQMGGETFDNGVLPTEPYFLYRPEMTLTASDCPTASACTTSLRNKLLNFGTVFIDGNRTVDDTIPIPTGRQIIGKTDVNYPYASSSLTLSSSTGSKKLFEILMDPPNRYSQVSIRDLELKTSQSGHTAISINTDHCTTIGNPPVPDPNDPDCSVAASSDMEFTGLKIDGFATGVYAGPRLNHDPDYKQMMDGIAWKNVVFINNQNAVITDSGNASNWNLAKIDIRTDDSGATGWFFSEGGHHYIQNLRCQGTSGAEMTDCMRAKLTGNSYYNEIKPTAYVLNNLTFSESAFVIAPGVYTSRQAMGSAVIRNSDFRSALNDRARLNIIGRTYLTSMNNRYGHFNITNASSIDDVSRITSCGDQFTADPAFDGLAQSHQNLFFGHPTKSLVYCGSNTTPWEDAFNFGDEAGDVPLVGSFYQDTVEDQVIYRDGTPSSPQSKFYIRKADGTAEQQPPINWGTDGDIGLTGRIFQNLKSAVIIFRPSNGQWWINDPHIPQQLGFGWGLAGDVPFTGNFLDETTGGLVTGNYEEVVVYRPSDGYFYVLNPRDTNFMVFVAGDASYGSLVQVGDFLGLGYDQLAQFNASNGNWRIVDARFPYNRAVIINFGSAGDVPVAGRYVDTAASGPECTQLGVWTPSTNTFSIKASQVNHCVEGLQTLTWGSNNDYGHVYLPLQVHPNDIPFTITTLNGLKRRPAVFRPTNGAFEFSKQRGLWFIHDPF